MKRVFGVLLLTMLCLCGGAFADEILLNPTGGPTLTEALAAAQDGDVILLAPGVYAEPRETFPLVVDKAVTIRGEDGATLQGPAFKSTMNITASDVTVEHVRFEFLRWGMQILGDRAAILNCDFHLADDTHRVSSCGIWMAGVYDCAVKDCRFAGCGLSVAGPPLSERSQGMPVLTGLFEVGDDVRYFTSQTVVNNTINGRPMYYLIDQPGVTVPKDAGGLIAVRCDDLVIDGLDVSDSSMGLQVMHSRNVTVRDTRADRCGVFGIYLGYVDGGLVQRCTVRNANHAIDMRSVNSLYVTDCVTDDCEQGIFYSFGFDCVTDRCTITRCGNGYFAACGEHAQITRCYVAENENGIYLQGEYNTYFSDNEITGNTVTGVRMLRSGGQCVRNRIHDNWVGVMINSTGHATLWENTFVDNASAQLYIKDFAGGKIMENTFAGESKAQLEIASELTDVWIAQNHFEATAEEALQKADDAADPTMNEFAQGK